MPRSPRRDHFSRAITAYERGRLVRAEELCLESLKSDVDDFNVLHLLAVVKGKLGKLSEAVAIFDKALVLRPTNADLHNNRGTVLTDLQRFDEALLAYEHAVHIKPDFAAAYNNCGCLFMFMERFEDALSSYAKALVLAPHNAEFINNLGRALTRLKRYDDAMDCYDDAIREDPNYIDPLINRGKAYEELQCFDDAAQSYGQALKIGADKTGLLVRRASALYAAKRYREALQDYQSILRRDPDRHDAIVGRSLVFAKLGQLDQAFEGFNQAEAMGADRADVLIHRCLLLNELGRSNEALVASEAALAQRPENADAHNARGLVFMNMERFDDAIDCFNDALAIRPQFPFVEWNLAYLSLLQGHFVEGWRRYEARRRQDGTRWTRLDGPEWTGEPVVGKRILLYAEQGFGDTIQFARYAGVLSEMGAHVILGVYKPLTALLRHVVGAAEVTGHGDPTPSFHVHAPLLSVPKILGHDESDTPSRAYLRADPARVALWAARLPVAAVRVGIAWQGSSAIPGRSVPLETFAPLAAIPGVTLISLQKTDGVDQLESLPSDMRVERLGADFDAGADAFLDTAAVMMNLDLIVSCDTAIAHLAGALGRPVWILLKTVPDWRWMMNRPDSPWYPSARLFRRRKNEDWENVMWEVAAALKHRLQHQGNPLAPN